MVTYQMLKNIDFGRYEITRFVPKEIQMSELSTL